MDRFQQIDATNSSIGALLYSDEEVVSLQGSVGLYDGKEKSLNQANGTVYLTSHRLIYIDDAQPHRHSCYLDLSLVKQSEYYAGFLKSSPKITLTLAPALIESSSAAAKRSNSSINLAATATPDRPSSTQPQPRDWRVNALAADHGNTQASSSNSNWICSICGFSNSPSAGDAAASCQLCGVTRDPRDDPPSRPSRLSGQLSRSLTNTVASPMAALSLHSNSEQQDTTRSKAAGLACPVCTFLNHPSMLQCEICGSSLATESLTDTTSSSPSPTPTPMTPRKSTDTDANSLFSQTPPRSSTPASRISIPADSIKLSFRRGGDKPFYSLLKPTLKAKAWSSRTGTGSGTGTSTPNVDIDGRSAAMRKAGIDSIMNNVDSSSRLQNDDMQGALKDLEALMTKAKQMVDFAEALNQKLTRQEMSSDTSAPDQEAATLIRSSLVRLGLPAPAVTEDMARDQKEYHLELARELAGLLLGKADNPGLMGTGNVLAKGKGRETLVRSAETGRGLVGLDEVWCVWNRARGIALVPPQALRSASLYLPDITSPSIQLRTFKSGLAVLHTPRYADGAFISRLVTFLDTHEGASTLDIAHAEQAPILLITEMIEAVELATTYIVRDDGGRNGTRWFVNRFRALSR